MQELKEILELSQNDGHTTEITKNKVLQAKALLLTTPNNNKELFLILAAMNLINAALKCSDFKSKERDALIYYGMLKPRVTGLIHHIIANSKKFDAGLYIDQSKQCCFIDIMELQFSFHNVTIDDTLKRFINSEANTPKEWKGVRLQKIAGELFDYTITKKEA